MAIKTVDELISMLGKVSPDASLVAKTPHGTYTFEVACVEDDPEVGVVTLRLVTQLSDVPPPRGKTWGDLPEELRPNPLPPVA